MVQAVLGKAREGQVDSRSGHQVMELVLVPVGRIRGLSLPESGSTARTERFLGPLVPELPERWMKSGFQGP